MYGFKTLEKKYGITVIEERWWNPLAGRTMKTYNIYSADGCPWEKGLTREGVKKECERWAESLLSIKKNSQRKVTATKIIYNKYSANGTFIAEREYCPKNEKDYDRVMLIIEQNPDEYELVNCVYTPIKRA